MTRHDECRSHAKANQNPNSANSETSSYWNIQNISPEQSSNLISNHIINTPINSDLCGEFNRRRRHTATKSTQDVDVSSSQCNGLGFERYRLRLEPYYFYPWPWPRSQTPGSLSLHCSVNLKHITRHNY